MSKDLIEVYAKHRKEERWFDRGVVLIIPNTKRLTRDLLRT